MDQFFVLGCFHEFVPSEIVSEKWMLIFIIVQIFTMLNTISTDIFITFLNKNGLVKAYQKSESMYCDEFNNTSLNTYFYQN